LGEYLEKYKFGRFAVDYAVDYTELTKAFGALFAIMCAVILFAGQKDRLQRFQ